MSAADDVGMNDRFDADAGPVVRRRGRPVLGAIAGLFLGIFVAVDLQQFAIRPLDNWSVLGLPTLGLVLGLALGRFAPLRRRPRDEAQATPAAEGTADAS
ncbi:MAG TPA: hypothetical protein VML96_07170 [Egibacteraceae bacterium]|nr:hypothetical protein [Egibacteraceae bacterium]